MSLYWLVPVFVVANFADNTVLKSSEPNNDCESEDDRLQQFLSSCLKNPSHIEEVEGKLKHEGIDYDTLFQLQADDIRATFKDIGIKSWHTGLIINKLYDIKGSGVEKYPSHSIASSIVVLNNEQNNYILELNQNIANIQINIAKLEKNALDINQSAKIVSMQINAHFDELFDILSARKNSILKQLDTIKTRKLKLTKDQTFNASNALNYLQDVSRNITDIINAGKLDVAEKQDAITELIDKSQQSLLKHYYYYYLQRDIQLATQPLVEYIANKNSIFDNFVNNMNDILDTDINLIDVRFDTSVMFIDWNTNLFNLTDYVLIFALQFKQLNGTDNDINEQWRELHWLSREETELHLNTSQLELLEEYTEYQFRIEVILLNDKIHSQRIKCVIKELPALISSIITSEKERNQLLQWIPNGRNRKFVLLFRASRDGFAASIFHQKCDDQGETLVIVKSKGNHVFGGYTQVSWKGNSNYVRDDDSWLYLLRSSRGDQPHKMVKKSDEVYVVAGPAYGPIFGVGHEIYVANNCNTNTNSRSVLGVTFYSPYDIPSLAESIRFKCIDYEVWRLN